MRRGRPPVPDGVRHHDDDAAIRARAENGGAKRSDKASIDEAWDKSQKENREAGPWGKEKFAFLLK